MKILLLILIVVFGIYSLANAQMINPILVNPAINQRLGNGNGMQMGFASGCTTSASVGASCPTTINFTVPMIDTGYISVCSCEGLTTGIPVIGNIASQSPSATAVTTYAMTAVAASCQSIACLAIHP